MSRMHSCCGAPAHGRHSTACSDQNPFLAMHDWPSDKRPEPAARTPVVNQFDEIRRRRDEIVKEEAKAKTETPASSSAGWYPPAS